MSLFAYSLLASLVAHGRWSRVPIASSRRQESGRHDELLSALGKQWALALVMPLALGNAFALFFGQGSIVGKMFVCFIDI